MIEGDSEAAAVDPPRPLRRRPSRRARRRRSVATLVVLIALVGASVWLARRGGDDGTSAIASAATTVADTASAASGAPASTSTAPASTSTGPSRPELDRTLRGGSTGDDVAMVQRRLNELGFLVGEPDGRFGPQTEEAVWAYKKLVGGAPPAELVGDPAASDVTPRLWAVLRDASPLGPRREMNDTIVEIHLPEQVLAVFERGTPLLFAHLSSADGAHWCDEITADTDFDGKALDAPVTTRECGVARTPGGVFEVTAVASGTRRTPIGEMEDPVFFNHVIAIHGASRVPLERATRGGVAVSTFVAGVVARLVDAGTPVLVWGDDGRQPEDYSTAESLPTFNSLDPDCIIGLYTLREGDTRALVAAKFDITEVELNGANVATEGYLEFMTGLEIIIPPADCPSATTAAVPG